MRLPQQLRKRRMQRKSVALHVYHEKFRQFALRVVKSERDAQIFFVVAVQYHGISATLRRVKILSGKRQLGGCCAVFFQRDVLYRVILGKQQHQQHRPRYKQYYAYCYSYVNCFFQCVLLYVCQNFLRTLCRFTY